MDILDIFLDILLKPPQPLMGLFSLVLVHHERSQNTVLLASTQAVYKSTHSTV